MRTKTTVLLVLLICGGCARFSTKQTDTRTEYDETGKATATTSVTTVAKASTFLSAKSDLANWKAKQTETTQGAEVGNLSQSSSGTNVVDVLNALAGVIGAIPK
jgi:hypothetical protein